MSDEPTLNVNVHNDVALMHMHDETAVPMTPIGQAPDETSRVGLSRTVFNHQGDFECPQCHTIVSTDVTTTTDIEAAGNVNVRFPKA